MDTSDIKQRNYRTVEALRQQRMREQRRLAERVHQDIGGPHRAELAEITFEQRKIKKELAHIKKSTPAWHAGEIHKHYKKDFQQTGSEPKRSRNSRAKIESRDTGDAGDGEGFGHKCVHLGNKRVRKISSNLQQKNEEDMKQTLERLQKFNQTYPIESDASSEVTSQDTLSQSGSFKTASIGDLNITDARGQAARRILGFWGLHETKQKKSPESPRRTLVPIKETQNSASQPGNQLSTTPNKEKGTSDKSRQSKSESKASRWKTVAQKAVKAKKEEEMEALLSDPAHRNPDGSMRTLHALPDFQQSLREAMHARYVRFTYKPWFEREISVSDMFPKKKVETPTSADE